MESWSHGLFGCCIAVIDLNFYLIIELIVLTLFVNLAPFSLFMLPQNRLRGIARNVHLGPIL